MKVSTLASCNGGQADVVIIPVHRLVGKALHQLKSWKGYRWKQWVGYQNITVLFNLFGPLKIASCLSLTKKKVLCRDSFLLLKTNRVWWTGEGSSRYSGSSSPSSCPAYTGSHVMGWTAAPTWRWHTGSWLRGRASCCRCRPRTDAKSADVGCTSRRSSTSLRPPSSPCWPVWPLTELWEREHRTKRANDAGRWIFFFFFRDERKRAGNLDSNLRVRIMKQRERGSDLDTLTGYWTLSKIIWRGYFVILKMWRVVRVSAGTTQSSRHSTHIK